jgi:tetratricopeptide (TPR) repeat protein
MLIALYGKSLQRLLALENVSIVAGDLPSASAIANELLQGADYERAMGSYTLGEIELLQGHFVGAREAWQRSVKLSEPLGTQGPLLQSLEELVSLDEFIGDVDSLKPRLAHLVEIYEATPPDLPRSTAHKIALDGYAKPRICPKLAELVKAFPDESTRATFERQVWRAAASVGCVPCSEVVRLGGSSSERSVRGLYRFATCAAHEGQLELARDAFMQARPLLTMMENSSRDPSTVYAILSDFQLGRVLARLGQPAQARAAYERFLARWGQTDRPVAEADEARRALATLR